MKKGGDYRIPGFIQAVMELESFDIIGDNATDQYDNFELHIPEDVLKKLGEIKWPSFGGRLPITGK